MTTTEIIEAIDLRVGDVLHLDWSSTPRKVTAIDYLDGRALGYEYIAADSRRGTFYNHERIAVERIDAAQRAQAEAEATYRDNLVASTARDMLAA